MRNANKKATKKPSHNNTPTVIQSLIIFYDKLCNKCCVKPKIKKSYCYITMLPSVLSLKMEITKVFEFSPKSEEDTLKKIKMIENIIDIFKTLHDNLKNVYEQHIFRDEDYNSLEEVLSEASVQMIKWRNSERNKIKNLKSRQTE